MSGSVCPIEIETTRARAIAHARDAAAGHRGPCAAFVLLGGTPYPPNSRLPSYLLEAIGFALESERKPSLVLCSTEDGGAEYNYPTQANAVHEQTQAKLRLLRGFLTAFFPAAFANVLVYRQPFRRPQPVWEALLAYVVEQFPAETQECLQTIQGFVAPDQNAAYAGCYATRHAFWARDLVFSAEPAGKLLTNPDLMQISFGGEKEAAVNAIRDLVSRLALQNPERISAILGADVETRQHIVKVVTPFGTPVPYGRATFSVGSGPHRKVKVADVELGDGDNPFAIRGGQRLAPLRSELLRLAELIAQHHRITVPEAAVRYAEFWRAFHKWEN